MAIADGEGLDGLSMRKVAAALGCEVMSLYNHVGGKDDLLDEMVDRVYGEIPEPSSTAAWRPALRDVAMHTREALVRHHWAGELITGRFPGPLRRRHMDAMLRVLAGAGLPEDVADLGFHALLVHVQGFTQQQAGFRSGAALMAEHATQFLAGPDADATPHLVAHFRYHDERGHRHDDFEFVLDLILDGLERSAGTLLE